MESAHRASMPLSLTHTSCKRETKNERERKKGERRKEEGRKKNREGERRIEEGREKEGERGVRFRSWTRALLKTAVLDLD